MQKIVRYKAAVILFVGAAIMIQCCCCIIPLRYGSRGGKPPLDPNLPAALHQQQFICGASQGSELLGVSSDRRVYKSQDGGQTWVETSPNTVVPPTCVAYINPK